MRILRGTWPVLPVFGLIRRLGRSSDAEMARRFNLGLGLLVVVPPPAVDEALKMLLDAGERAHVIGTVTRTGKVAFVG